MSVQRWIEKRRRRTLARWRSTIAPMPKPSTPLICLFCDFEGHHAGAHAGQVADMGTDILLKLLDRQHIRITFNVVSDLCLTHPERIRRIANAGHEIACHGRRHERPRDLNDDALDEMLASAISDFSTLGIRPQGFRSPESAWSCRLVRRLPQFGFAWNAERDFAKGPYRIRNDLVRLPVRTDDWDLTDPAERIDDLLAKWNGAAKGVIQSGGVLCLGVHEWIFGDRPDFGTALETKISEWREGSPKEFVTLMHAVRTGATSMEQS